MGKVVSLLCVMLLLVLSYCSKALEVWDSPTYYNQNVVSLDALTMVELKSDETVLHLSIKNSPLMGWGSFAKSSVLRTADGKEYKILNGEATCDSETPYELDSLLTLDENGEANVALHFEPLPAATKCFDYDENAGEGSFRIWGIQKDPIVSEIPKEWQNVQYAENEKLPDAFVEKKNATIKVKMLGFRKGMLSTAVVEGFSMIMGEPRTIWDKYVMDEEAGEIVFDLPLAWPRTVSVFFSGVSDMRSVLVAPGETVEILVDLFSKDNPIAFKGFMAKTNMDLARLGAGLSYNTDMIEAAKEFTSGSEKIAAIRKASVLEFDKVNAMDITDAAKAIVRMGVEFMTYSCIANYGEVMYSRKLRNGEIEFSQESMMQEMKDFQSQLDEKELAKVVDEMTRTMECINAKYAPFWELFFEAFPDADAKDTSLNADLHRMWSRVRSPKETSIIYSKLCKEIADEYVENAVKNMAQDNVLGWLIDLQSDQKFDVPTEAFIPFLLGKHTGKVVLIDVWATWCGPCKRAHPEMDMVKKELEGKDIDYVYLALESSDMDQLKEMIKDISGEHYVISKSVAISLAQIYGSTGVPTYAVYNKQGELTYKSVGFPGREDIKKALLSALGE